MIPAYTIFSRFAATMAIVAALLWLPASALAAGEPRWVEPATGIEFVRIPGGEFAMGSSGGGSDELPIHPVRLRTFYLARFEVTQAQWRAVMGKNPAARRRSIGLRIARDAFE